MTVVFMGTPDFAVPCLVRLADDGYDIRGVFTNPDRPKGRGMKLTISPVKEQALRYVLPVFQPQTLKTLDVLDTLRALAPDVIVVVAYGQILPPDVLAIPPLGCLNVHASLLPAYRGAAPIQWSIIRGETETGVTTMHMAKGLDTGDIIDRMPTPIGARETAGTLSARLSDMGADLLAGTLSTLQSGTASRTPQDDAQATYAPLITREMGRIDWTRPAPDIDCLIRGLSPAPGAYTYTEGASIKIWDAVVWDNPADAPPGAVLPHDDGFVTACGDKTALLVTGVQGPGGKRMSARAYLNGHPLTRFDV